MLSSLKPKIIIVGGAGALGRVLTATFRPKWDVTSIDVVRARDSTFSVLLPPNETPQSQAAAAAARLTGKYRAILCVAGGFTMGSAASPDIFPQCEQMMKMNVNPSLLAAHLATKFMEDNGMLMFTGAAVPFKSTAPACLAYSLAKNAVHSLALNMAARTDLSSVATVVTILPSMIDTPANREAMPDADKSEWLSPEGISKLVKAWVDGKNRPDNGSFVLLKKEKGEVVPEFV